MKIQINTMCFQYWKRLFWFLSSIVEQNKPAPIIKIRINTCLKNDNYKYMQKGVENIFNNLLDIEWIDWNAESGFDIRGMIRNSDLLHMEEDTDWMLWTDPDQIYHPNHFNFLLNNINDPYYDNKLLSITRNELTLKDSLWLIAGYKYRKSIKNCFDKIKELEYCQLRKNLGIGYYQLVSKKTIINKKITEYSGIDRDTSLFGCLINKNDIRFKTRSDIDFRKKFKISRIYDCPEIYHLDHYRRITRNKHFKIGSF